MAVKKVTKKPAKKKAAPKKKVAKKVTKKKVAKKKGKKYDIVRPARSSPGPRAFDDRRHGRGEREADDERL
jgi:hypothetical protein